MSERHPNYRNTSRNYREPNRQQNRQYTPGRSNDIPRRGDSSRYPGMTPKTLTPNYSQTPRQPRRSTSPRRNSNKKPPVFLIIMILLILGSIGYYQSKTKNVSGQKNNQTTTTQAATQKTTQSNTTTTTERPQTTTTTTERITEATTEKATIPEDVSTTEAQTADAADTSKIPFYYFPDEADLLAIGTEKNPITDMQTLVRYLSMHFRESTDSELTVYLKGIDSDYMSNCLSQDTYYYDSTFIDELRWSYYPDSENSYGSIAFHFQSSPTMERYVYNAYMKGTSIEDAKATQLYNKVVSILSTVVTSDMNALEKEFAIHDYIVNNCTYNTSTYQQEAYGCLIDGNAVCQGYAQAFELLMLCCEVETRYVSGQGENENHAWNQICLNNTWYNVDITWDDPSVPGNTKFVSGSENHTFLNVTDDVMRGSKHIWNENQAYPANSLEYNYAKAYGRYFDNYDDYQNAVCSFFQYSDEDSYECVITDYSSGNYDNYNFIFDYTDYSESFYHAIKECGDDYTMIKFTKYE